MSICNPVAATESTDSNPSVSYLRVSGIPGAPKCPNGATIQLDQICNHVYANSAYSPCGSDTPAPHPMRSMHSVHDMRDMHDALDKECGHGSHSYLQSCSKSKLTGDEGVYMLMPMCVLHACMCSITAFVDDSNKCTNVSASTKQFDHLYALAINQ